MQDLEKAFKIVSSTYAANGSHGRAAQLLAVHAMGKLVKDAKVTDGYDLRLPTGRRRGGAGGRRIIPAQTAPDVRYTVFSIMGTDGKEVFSRPWRSDLLPADAAALAALQAQADAALTGRNLSEDGKASVTRYVYAAVQAVACCYDLWKPGSRKTPGTYFEMLAWTLLQVYLPEHHLTKHVDLGALLHTGGANEAAGTDTESVEEERSNLSTDIVVRSNCNGLFAVVPLKITTRERIVQPFAHQRILETAYPGSYRSFLCCISETQRDGKTRRTKQICVPGTIKLFQKFLSPMEGIYYGDEPYRYASLDLRRHIKVATLGQAFEDLKSYLDAPPGEAAIKRPSPIATPPAEGQLRLEGFLIGNPPYRGT